MAAQLGRAPRSVDSPDGFNTSAAGSDVAEALKRSPAEPSPGSEQLGLRSVQSVNDHKASSHLTRGLKLDRSLRLAVQWDRVEVLRDILENRQAEVVVLKQVSRCWGHF